MYRVRKTMFLVSAISIGMLLLIALAACGTTTTPSPAPSSSAKPSASASTATSPAASAPASAAASAAPGTVGGVPADAQAFQKAQANWSKIVEAARGEGTALIYAVSDQAMLDKWQTAFNKIDPKIQVSLIRQATQVQEKIRAEAATKQYTVNGYWGGGTSTRQIVADGLTQSIEADIPSIWDPAAKWAVSPVYDKPRETVTGSLTTYFFVYNTNLVKPADLPKTWKDLTDPKWKGQVAFWDPRLPGHGQQAMAILYLNPDYGPDFVKKMVDNMLIAPDGVGIGRSVAKGDYSMGMITYSAYIPVKDGPVKLWVPQEGTFVSPTQLVVVKNAPQLNVTKVFLNWILSKEGQTITSDGLGAVRSDITPAIPEIQLGAVKMFPGMPITWDQEQNKSKTVTPIYGKWISDAGK